MITHNIIFLKLRFMDVARTCNSCFEKVLFLLHAANFTSETWAKRGTTMTTMAGLGRRVVAIDLPGFGKTSKLKSGDDDDDHRGAFLEAVIKKLCSKKEKVILVSPANSGLFSLPLLKRNQASSA